MKEKIENNPIVKSSVGLSSTNSKFMFGHLTGYVQSAGNNTWLCVQELRFQCMGWVIQNGSSVTLMINVNNHDKVLYDGINTICTIAVGDIVYFTSRYTGQACLYYQIL